MTGSTVTTNTVSTSLNRRTGIIRKRGKIDSSLNTTLELQSVIRVRLSKFPRSEVRRNKPGELAESLVPNPLTAHEIKNNEKIQKQILYETAIAEVMR